MLEGRAEQFTGEVVVGEKKNDRAGAARNVAAAIDRWVWYAGWPDKVAQVTGGANAVAGPYFNLSVPEPSGVVAVLAPPEAGLLGLVSVLAPVIATGNTAVLAVSGPAVLAAVSLAEVLATSDVPGGVVNVLTGRLGELAPVLAAHQDVNAIDLTGAAPADRAEPGTARGREREAGVRGRARAGDARPRTGRRIRACGGCWPSWRPRPSGTRSAPSQVPARGWLAEVARLAEFPVADVAVPGRSSGQWMPRARPMHQPAKMAQTAVREGCAGPGLKPAGRRPQRPRPPMTQRGVGRPVLRLACATRGPGTHRCRGPHGTARRTAGERCGHLVTYMGTAPDGHRWSGLSGTPIDVVARCQGSVTVAVARLGQASTAPTGTPGRPGPGTVGLSAAVSPIDVADLAAYPGARVRARAVDDVLVAGHRRDRRHRGDRDRGQRAAGQPAAQDIGPDSRRGQDEDGRERGQDGAARWPPAGRGRGVRTRRGDRTVRGERTARREPAE